MEGRLFTVNEAHTIGLIDEIVSHGNLLAAAEKKIRAYIKLNPTTWSQSKLNLRNELLSKIKADQTPVLQSMLKQWWAPATRQGLQLMIQNLKSKSAAATN